MAALLYTLHCNRSLFCC